MAAQYERIYRRLVAQHKEHVVGEGGVLTAQPEERVMRALHSQPHGEDREEYRADAPLERRGQRLEAPAAQQGNVAREP
jgi:hypothetical protein